MLPNDSIVRVVPHKLEYAIFERHSKGHVVKERRGGFIIFDSLTSVDVLELAYRYTYPKL